VGKTLSGEKPHTSKPAQCITKSKDDYNTLAMQAFSGVHNVDSHSHLMAFHILQPLNYQASLAVIQCQFFHVDQSQTNY